MGGWPGRGLLLVAVAIYNFTRFGLVTRAVVESEKGSVIVGVSPERVALANWGLGALIAGLAGAVISPLVAVTPSGFTLLVVPALAVALVGGFSNLAGDRHLRPGARHAAVQPELPGGTVLVPARPGHGAQACCRSTWC